MAGKQDAAGPLEPCGSYPSSHRCVCVCVCVAVSVQELVHYRCKEARVCFTAPVAPDG